MKITCVTLTCGRTAHLNEAIECFLRQDHPDKSLVVLNTCPQQTLLGDFPNVTIVNLKERPVNLGTARNIAVEHCSANAAVCLLDDDDLALPHYLSVYARLFESNPEAKWVWVDKQFYLEGGKIQKIAMGMCNTFAFTRDVWRLVGGYDQKNVGEDRSFVGKATAAATGLKATVSHDAVAYLYCWGNGVYHISGLGDDVVKGMNSWERARIDVESRLRRGVIPNGEIVLRPEWKHDYVAMVGDYFASRRYLQTVRHGDVVRSFKHKIIHAVEQHEEIRVKRKLVAQKSWETVYSQGVIGRHYHEHAYVRDARSIGDKRSLPFLKDALEEALNIAEPDDIVFLTNDDTVLHPALPDLLIHHVSRHGPCSSQRCEFASRLPPLSEPPEKFAALGRKHMGRDLFAATARWWEEHWDEMGDPILGASDWDLHFACMFRMHYGIRSSRKNLEDVIHPAEIPRGYIIHEAHRAKWLEPSNVWSAKSQIHNRLHFKEWAAKYMPELKFCEGNVI